MRSRSAPLLPVDRVNSKLCTPNIVLTGQLAQPAYSCAKQPASNELNIKVIACLPAEIFTL